MQYIKKIDISEQKVFNGRVLPLTISPFSEPVSDFGHLLDYVKKNNYEILQQTLTFGALLFRGWQDISPNDFAIFSESLGLKKYQYIGGAAPRKNIVRDVVFTTNESPPTEPIPFHHELAQSPNPPDKNPIRNPTNGKDQAAFVKSGSLSEKYDQLIGILVKNIMLAKRSNTYLFLNTTCMIKFFY